MALSTNCWKYLVLTFNFLFASGILILAVVLIEFGCFVWAMSVWEDTDITVKTAIRSYFNQTMSNPNSGDAIRWDRLQGKFQCCGISGPSDYTSVGHVPFSCCGVGPIDPINESYVANCNQIYQRGCSDLLYKYTERQLLWVAVIAFLASILQVISI
ncbi:23 kDa integral membrane protein [Eumeta japonica]|uniref:23 kDa integral membrane protein n=1 Tax=Eumeta variegata TaxID=151549 RepID=A0A4C1UJC8_EUMVA|nr:23 kDa integral membrane protein [Eumeta japonica]